jgi:hypothetical protein
MRQNQTPKHTHQNTTTQIKSNPVNANQIKWNRITTDRITPHQIKQTQQTIQITQDHSNSHLTKSYQIDWNRIPLTAPKCNNFLPNNRKRNTSISICHIQYYMIKLKSFFSSCFNHCN